MKKKRISFANKTLVYGATLVGHLYLQQLINFLCLHDVIIVIKLYCLDCSFDC